VAPAEVDVAPLDPLVAVDDVVGLEEVAEELVLEVEPLFDEEHAPSSTAPPRSTTPRAVPLLSLVPDNRDRNIDQTSRQGVARRRAHQGIVTLRYVS
jgi:hypothetical protein